MPKDPHAEASTDLAAQEIAEAGASSAAGVGGTGDTRFFGHPIGLSNLFFTELFERFSYYGMRALLVLFMTAATVDGGLGYDVATSALIYGLYTSLVYLVNLPGGWIADRLLGQRSEEHTSELQSRENLVCRLLLEKKKIEYYT